MIKGSQQRRNGSSRIGRHNIFFLISLFINIFLGYKLWTTSALKEFSDQQFERAQVQMSEMNHKQQTIWTELNEKKAELQKQKTELERATNAAQGCYDKLTGEEKLKSDCDASLKRCNEEKTECTNQLSSSNSQVQTSIGDIDKCKADLDARTTELDTCTQEKANYMAEVERMKLEADGKKNVDGEVKRNVPSQQPDDDVHKTTETAKAAEEQPVGEDVPAAGTASNDKNTPEPEDVDKKQDVDEKPNEEDTSFLTCAFGEDATDKCLFHNGGDGHVEWRLKQTSEYSPHKDELFAVFDSDDVKEGGKGMMANLAFGPIKVSLCVQVTVTYHIVGEADLVAKMDNKDVFNDFTPNSEWTTVQFDFTGNDLNQVVELVATLKAEGSAVGVSAVSFKQVECDAEVKEVESENQ